MIQINPLKSYIDGGVRAALTTPPSASLVFDLPGKAIWVKGVKLKGTDHTYIFNHDNYITLTNTPDKNNPESEDIKIGVNITTLKNVIDTTYNGGTLALLQEGLNTEERTWLAKILHNYINNVLPITKNLQINGTNYAIYTTENSLPLFFVPVSLGTTGQILACTSSGLIWVDLIQNTDYRVSLSSATSNSDYRIILKQGANNNPETDFVRFSEYLTFNPYTKTLKINNIKVVTATDIYIGSNAGLVPAATSAQLNYYLRGDGTWVNIATEMAAANTWRPIKVGNTDALGSGSNTGTLSFIAGTGIALSWDATNKRIIITNSSPDQNHNTDETVRQVPKTDNVNRPLMMINGSTSAGEQINTSMFSTGIYANASTKMITANGFIKAGSSDNYVLLGGGNHKTLNDFSMNGHTHTDTFLVTNDDNYVGLSFRDTALSKLANKKYIECWDSAGGWWNWAAGKWIKAGSNDSYVLLGGGGHKAISDFAASGHNHDGRYLQYEGWWSSGSGQNIDNSLGMTFTYTNHGAPHHWGTTVTFEYERGSSYRLQLHGTGDNYLFFRNRSSDYGGWHSSGWKQILTNQDTYVASDGTNIGFINGVEVASVRHLLINGATWNSNWHWSGQSGQPTWLWGSNDGVNMYVWNPSNFSVNYANSAGNADTVDNEHASAFVHITGSTMSGDLTVSKAAGYEPKIGVYQEGYSPIYLVSGSNSKNRGLYCTELGWLCGWDANNNGFFNGNATSATNASKLSTVSKTAWGQTYWTDGGVPTTISGAMTGVTTIDGYVSFTTKQSSNPVLNISTISANTDYISIYVTATHRPLVLQMNAGNVGVGVAQPSYKLDVSGVIHSTTGIFSDGNVGIGTTSPTYKLHVAGDIYTTTGFKKNGSSDSYVLLGGGGHKVISDFNRSGVDFLTFSTSVAYNLWNRIGYVQAIDAGIGVCFLISIGSHHNSTVHNTLFLCSASYSGKMHIKELSGSHLSLVSIRINSSDNYPNKVYIDLKSESSYTSSGLLYRIKIISLMDAYISAEYLANVSAETYNTTFTSHTEGAFATTGSIYAAHFYENSDIRYKKILKNLLINFNTIANLPLFDFEWIENNTIGTGTSALAVLQILPNIVSGTDRLTLDYGVLGTIAGITACKELVILKSELLQLKEKVKLLEDKLRKYENIL